MSEEKEEEHDCTKINCDGKALNGLNLTCNNCGKPTFLTCITERDDVYTLLTSIELDKYNETKQKTTPNVNYTTIKRLKSIIGIESVFEFNCLQCKKIGSTSEKIKRMEKNIERVHVININLQRKLDTEYEKNKQLNITIKENRQLIERLTKEADKQTNGNAALNNNMYTQKMQKRIEDEMNKMKNKLNETIINECNNMTQSLLQQEIHIEQPQKTTKTVTINTPTSSKNTKGKEQTMRKTPNSIKNYFQQPQNQSQNESNYELRPPPHMRKNTNTKKSDNEMHAIYVSKFEYGTKKEAITQYIMKNIQTNKEEEVETRSNDPNYVAFKIITSKKELYNDIMEIWKDTEFYARKYEPKQKNETHTRNGNDTYDKSQYKNNKYEHHDYQRTPWKKMNRERERKTPSYKSNRNERGTPHHRYERSKRETPKYERETKTNARYRDESPQYRHDRYEKDTPSYRIDRNEK